MATRPAIPETLAAVVHRLLRPLVRLCMAHGLKFQQVAELLKSAFVEEATAGRSGARVNVSQVTVATGVHRKDVNRLLGAGPDARALPPSLEAEVFTRWIADPAFGDGEGRPLALPRQAADAPSFEALVRRVTVDLHPRTVLDAMQRLELVHEGPDGLLRLSASGFVPQPEDERMLAFLADNVHDHLAAAVSNTLRAPGGFLEQSVYGDGFTPASIAELHALSRRQWQRLLRETASAAQALEARDRGAPQAEQRFRVGMYFHAEPALPPAAMPRARARTARPRTIRKEPT